MSHGQDLVPIYCPYCGEKFDVVVDLSVDYQEYVEDCYVCCRPIVMSVTATGDSASVAVRHEDE